jgi:hypothetical protein
MTISRQPPPQLDALGDALRDAAAADVARAARRRRRRTLTGALAAAAIVLPGAALATSALISDDDVAHGLPSGAWALVGTDPHCTTVQENVEFDCVLSRPPREGDVAPGMWQGNAEPTLDSSKRISGSCRSLNAEGTHWRCYIGEEAVRRDMLRPDQLGQLQLHPGLG